MDIEICNNCVGCGEIKVTDYRNDWSFEKCTSCNGTGRILTSFYKYQIPFGVDTKLVYKIDTKICELIRELENSVKKNDK